MTFPVASATGTSRRWLIVMGLTLMTATALRVYGLDSGLWYDEISTLLKSVRLPLGRLIVESPGVNAHPLYSVLAHGSIAALGESPWALRLPACLFGIASVWMVFILGSRLTTSLEAWAGAAILATSYHHIWFSQNGRGYTMLAFFAMTATYFLLRARHTRQFRDYACYAAVCAAAIFTHLTMVWLVVGHATVLAVEWLRQPAEARGTEWKTAAWSWTAAAVMSALLYAPALPTLLNYFVVNAPLPAATVATPKWALMETVRSMLSGAGVPAALAMTALMVVGALSLMRRSPLAWALLVMPGVVAGAGLLILGQAIRPRFFFFLSGAAAIFVGRGIGVLASAISRSRSESSETPRPALVAGLVLLVVGAAAVQLPLNYQVPKQDFAGAVRYLDAKEAGGARIAAVGLACLPMNKYFGRTSWPCLGSVEEFDTFGGQRTSRFLVYTLADYIDDHGLQRRVVDGCDVVWSFKGTLGNGNVVVCEPRRRDGQ